MENFDIKMIELLKPFIYSIIPVLITLFLTAKIKGKINSKFDKEIEDIKKNHAIEIAKFESDLNYLKTRENYKFTKLHEKRFAVLEETYKNLNNALHMLDKYTYPLKHFSNETTFEDNEKRLLEKYLNANTQFIFHFSDNRIYFEEDLEILIDNYIKEISEVYMDYNMNHFLREVGEVDKEYAIKASKAHKKIEEKVIPLKRAIEIKFKELLEK